MPIWLLYSLIALLLWGVVGILQKVGTTRVSADSLVIWMMAGYVLLLPFLIPLNTLRSGSAYDMSLGILVGIVNGLGAWFLFLSLENGAKASIAIPLTALYPVVTIFLALIFLREELSVRQSVGIVTALAAGVLMSYESSPVPAGDQGNR